ncbi:MAG: hypothetical protein ABR584_05200 [Candidatus Baltobacteraceae bacterium]
MRSLIAFFVLTLLGVSSALADPSIVEFGPTFRSPIGQLVVSGDGTVYVHEYDGIAEVSPQGRITQTRRADDCGYYFCGARSEDIAIGPDAAVWTNGGDRILRFKGGRSNAFHIVTGNNYRDRYSAFALTSAGIYTATLGEVGIRRMGVHGNRLQFAAPAPVGYVQRMIAGTSDAIWLLVTQNPRGSPFGATLAFYSGSSLTQGLLGDYFSTRVVNAAAVAPDGSLVADVSNEPGGGQAPPAPLIVRISQRGAVTELGHLRTHNRWFNSIGGITIAKNNTVWFTEPSANRVGRIAPDGTLDEFRAGIPSGAVPTGIAAAGDGSVWFTDPARGTVDHLTPKGTVRVVGQPLSPLNTPGSVAVTSDGAAWFIETLSWHPRIARIAPDGAIKEFQAPLAQYRAKLQPVGKSVAYVVAPSFSQRGNTIAVLHPDGSVSEMSTGGCLVTYTNFACLPNAAAHGEFHAPDSSPQSVVRGPDGNLWFTDVAKSRIGRVDAQGRFTFYSTGLTRWHSGPQYITNGPDGALWFTEIRDRVGSITMEGRITEFPAGIPYRSFIGGIVAGPDGNLWFPLWHGNELARMTPDGIVTRFRQGIYPSRGNDDTIDSVPFVDKSGRIWFNEPQGGRIARASLSAGK